MKTAFYRWILPLLTVWILVYMISLPLVIGNGMGDWMGNGDNVRNLFRTLYILQCIHMTLILGLMVTYLTHMSYNKQVEGGRQVVWIFALLFGVPIAGLVYWLIHIRPTT